MKDQTVSALNFPDVVFIAYVWNQDVGGGTWGVVGVVEETGKKVGSHSLHRGFGDGLKDLAWGDVPPGVDAFFFGTFYLTVGESEEGSSGVFDGGRQADDLEIVVGVEFLDETGHGVFPRT
jgi:hypothetical protein